MRLPDLEQMVAALVFTGVRVGGVMVFAPFTGSEAIPAPVKAALTLLVTAVVYPATSTLGLRVDALGWISVAGREAIIGLALGLTLQFCFEAAQFAGQIFGVQTGFSLVTLLDPQTEADSPSLSVLVRLMAMLGFLKLDVHHWALRGIAASFSYLPPRDMGNLRWLGTGVVDAAAGVWVAGLQMAAPVLAVTVTADLALGFLGKVAPQLPATLAGLPLKSVVGLGVIALSAKAWPGFFEREFTRAIAHVEQMFHLAAG
jgi:flagellar biosynthesis protein FliR